MPFASLGLPEPITKGVEAAGYTEPTPVQRRAIPLILPGHDLVTAAQTGSGKTAAFVLPILVRLLKGPRALRALVLVPTRELAAQVEACARDYARFTAVRVGSVYGGVPIAPQERMLRREGVELLVATPGRLLDLQGRQSVSLDDIEVLVLDEADRMVDMGFAPDLNRILRLLPKNRQTLMFSATMPPELNKVASAALRNPQRLELAPPTRPAPRIEQTLYPVPRHLKPELLDLILRRKETESALVFVRSKHGADRLARRLSRSGHRIAVIHGDRSQGQREKALLDFRRGRADVLVATDIASRGIDVDDITHVINFDVPRTPEDYVHRIGRTGRMDAAGDAVTLMSPEEEKDVAAIERFMGRDLAETRLEGFDYTRRREKSEDSERGERDGAARGRGGRRERSGHGNGNGSGGMRSAAAAAALVPAFGRRPKALTAVRRGRKRI
jgi:ATP-dependent RNA helicase RhlE